MKKHLNKTICILLALVLIFSAFSFTALATESEAPIEKAEEAAKDPLASESDPEIEEEIAQLLTEHSIEEAFSPLTIKEGDKVLLTDSKAELISAIKSKEAFSIDGTVTKDGKAYRINEYYDFSTASKFDVAAWAYKAELLTEAEKIDCYCDLIIERNFENIYCLNPIYAEIEEYKASNKLSSELGVKLEKVFASPEEEMSEAAEGASTRALPMLYSSANFTIMYELGTTTLTDVKHVATYFEQLRTTFYNMGFRHPLLGSNSKYIVYLVPEAHSSYAGICFNNSSTTNVCSTYIKIYKFSSFNRYEDTDLKNLFAHEYFHAIQCAYNRKSNWFTEACANWAKVVITGNYDSFKERMDDFITNGYSLTYENDDNEYGAALYPFAVHKLCGGSEAIVTIYETYNQYPATITEAQFQGVVTEALEDLGSIETFDSIYRKMTAFVCNVGYWYESVLEAFAYDEWDKPTTTTITVNGTSSHQVTLDSFSSSYYTLTLPNGVSGSIEIEAIFYSGEGTIQIYEEMYNTINHTIYFPETTAINSSTYKATYTLSPNALNDYYLIVSNTSTVGDILASINISLSN